MSDYPMLISNKLHSFRNFYPAKFLPDLLATNLHSTNAIYAFRVFCI